MKAILPDRPELEDLLAFWASIAIVLGLAIGSGAWLTGLVTGPGAVVLGTVATLAFVRLGQTSERSLNRFYMRWNRGGKKYARRARTVTGAIWYWTVVTAVGSIGGSGLNRRGSSWLERGSAGGTADRVAHGGFRDYARWAVRSGRSWALVLLPLLWLLKAFEGPSGSSDARNIYTLY